MTVLLPPSCLEFFVFLFFSLTHLRAQTSDSSILWKTYTIPVCWINASEGNRLEREWVQRAIKKTWQVASSLKFEDWCDCKPFRPNQQNGIRILISKRQARVTHIGYPISRDSIGMYLDFTFNSGIYLPVRTEQYSVKNRKVLLKEIKTDIIHPDQTNRKLFIEAQAVHEFGHALGFSHEQGRKDCNYGEDCVFPEPVPAASPIMDIRCNERSVMNYCNDIYLNEGFLSNQDKYLLQRFYCNANPCLVREEPLKISYSYDPPRSRKKGVNQQQSQKAKEIKSIKVKPRKIYIYLTGPDSILQGIERVEYFFHRETFKPIMINNSKNTDFSILLKEVWGSFTSEAKIYYRDADPVIISNYIICNPKLKRKLRWDIHFFRDPYNKSNR